MLIDAPCETQGGKPEDFRGPAVENVSVDSRRGSMLLRPGDGPCCEQVRPQLARPHAVVPVGVNGVTLPSQPTAHGDDPTCR